MPIYEYECEKCHKITEAWQHLSDAPLATCPDCQGDLKKLISHSSFQLKGGGWYADGYCSSNKKESSTKSTSASKPASSGSATSSACPKSESKSCCACAASS